MNIYLNRYAWQTPLFRDYSSFQAGIVVVIPSYKEPGILHTLHSLKACTPPEEKVVVLVVINEPEDASEEVRLLNMESYVAVQKFPSTSFDLKSVFIRLPPKKAGVGLARKIGMDEAVRILEAQQKDGIIVGLDADCICQPNYFTAISAFFQSESKNLGLIHFAHDLNGPNAPAIISYELFLRYYINALRYSGYPYAVQTLGSCIAVRSSAYQKQGGMNTRKAGEDFYFIHKMVSIGGIGEITGTVIIPSDRISDRVPFGTGHAIGKLVKQSTTDFSAYNPLIFEDFKAIISQHEKIYMERGFNFTRLSASVDAFYESCSFQSDLEKILRHSNSPLNFSKKYFRWWDGFRVLKFIHFARDHFHPNVSLDDAMHWLNENYLHLSRGNHDPKAQLQEIRNFDMNHPLYIK